MSPPTEDPSFSVQLDAVAALAAELAALAGELSDDAALCRSTATSLSSALVGEISWWAGSAATGWGALTEVVAARSAAVAGTLETAVAAYRADDLALAASIGSGLPHRPDGPR
jgi:hypothetical protein